MNAKQIAAICANLNNLPMKSSKETYRRLCLEESSIPIFSRDWWLDATAGNDNWDVAVVEKGGGVVATLPFVLRRNYGFLSVTQPPLTQTLGPWIRPSCAKYAKRLAQEKDLMQALIEQLPPFRRYAQNWHRDQTNWLPFYWQGFRQTTRYSYVITELGDRDVLWQNLQPGIRTDIKKATARFGLRVREAKSIEEFYKINKMTFLRQGQVIPYSLDFVKRIDQACNLRNARRTFLAEDGEGRVHAAVYLIWDENSAYYLMGGGDPKLRNSGATSLCMWEAIRFAGTVTKNFDFEGSMLEPVERFFRSFGAKQIPYFSVTKSNSKLIELRDCVATLWRR